MALSAAEKQKRYRDRNKVTRVTEPEQPSVTVCKTCGGPVQHPAIVKCLKCCTGTPVPKLEPGPTAHLAGPLSVYSPDRWARQQDRYIWDVSRQRAYRGGYELVTVPGDPAYQGVAS